MNFQLLFNSFILLLYNQGFFSSFGSFFLSEFQVMFFATSGLSISKMRCSYEKAEWKERATDVTDYPCWVPFLWSQKATWMRRSSSKPESLYGPSPGNLLLKGYRKEQGLVQDAVEQGICSPSFPPPPMYVTEPPVLPQQLPKYSKTGYNYRHLLWPLHHRHGLRKVTHDPSTPYSRH